MITLVLPTLKYRFGNVRAVEGWFSALKLEGRIWEDGCLRNRRNQ